MNTKLQEEVRKLLHPLMMCSVSERYALLYQTEIGRRWLSSLDLQGSTMNVANSVISNLMRSGEVELGKFVEEIRKLPRPEWYKG